VALVEDLLTRELIALKPTFDQDISDTFFRKVQSLCIIPIVGCFLALVTSAPQIGTRFAPNCSLCEAPECRRSGPLNERRFVPIRPSSPLDGIIAHLTRQCGEERR
jgi:hypothetical protein